MSGATATSEINNDTGAFAVSGVMGGGISGSIVGVMGGSGAFTMRRVMNKSRAGRGRIMGWIATVHARAFCLKC